MNFMLTQEESELLYELLSKAERNDLYVFDTSKLSTAIDNSQAAYLTWLHEFSFRIYKAIAELYIIDITGCLDSEL